MSISKRLVTLAASLALTGLMLALVIGLVSAAGGGWQPADLDGGQVVELAAAANVTPTILYARTGANPWLMPFPMTGSGLWKSTNGGTTWQATMMVVDDATGDSNLLLSEMAVSGDGQTIYAASAHRWPAWSDARIWRSTDGGESWSSIVMTNTTVGAIAFFENAGVAAVGFANDDDHPLSYSIEGDTTWMSVTGAAVTSPYTQANIHTLAAGSVMYAGGDTHVPALADDRAAVYTSANGITWTLAFTHPSNTDSFFQIVADPSDAGRAYALVGTPTPPRGAVYSTTNKGQTWTALSFQPCWPAGGTVSSIAVDSGGRLYAATTCSFIFEQKNQVYRSTDHGGSWGLVGQTAGGKQIASIAVDPNDDDLLYLGSDDWDHSAGVYKTPSSYHVGLAGPAGLEFQPANSGLRAYEVRDVASNSANPNIIYAATAGQGVIKSTDGGQTWSRTSEGVSPIADAVAVHPSDAETANFGGFDTNLFFWNNYRTSDGGIIWNSSIMIMPSFVDLAVHPVTPTVLYGATNGGVMKTTDGGQSWAGMGPPANGIALHPITPSIIYAADTSGPVIYKSTDGGTTWLPPKVVSGTSPICDVLVNPTTPSEVYAISCEGVFFKSSDAWATWPVTDTRALTSVLGIDQFNFPAPQFGWPNWLLRLAYDSAKDVIYATMGQYGLFASDDGGATWSKVTGNNVPAMAMRSVFYQAGNNALYLGGSTGLWRMGGPSRVYLPIVMRN